MTGLHQQIRRTIRRERLLPAGARVLVGLSGGADSVALVHLLRDLAVHAPFEVVGLAHFNHQLRPTADRDEQFCRRLAADLSLDLQVEHTDVGGYARAQRLSVEDAARRLRYEFLARAATRRRADHLAVGHTADDQAETVLFKLIRGAGLTGLGGISPRKGQIVRPLLDVSKRELVEYLAARAVAWVDDESNEDLANPRNRLRHVVLPELERTYPGAARAIARSADLSRSDGQWLEQSAAALFAEVAVDTPSGFELDAKRLAAMPRPLARRVLLTALRAVCGSREIGLDHIRAAEDVLGGACAGADVPGGRLELRLEKVVLSRTGLQRSDTLTE